MLKITPKQNEVVKAIRERDKEIVLLTGVIGSSKTFGAAAIGLSIAKQYPGAVVGVGKKNRTEIVSGTMYSFEKAASTMGIEYTQNLQQLTWTLNNKSRLQFYELDITKDREFNKPKKMELTCNIIDEADAVAEEGFWAAHGRVGRVNDCIYCNATPKDIEDGAECVKEKHKTPPAFSLLTCNPNEAWIAEALYKKYKDPETNGELPEEMEVIEFFQEDSMLGRAYYEKYKNAPKQFKERYLYNNWSYGDDENSLFKYRHMDSCHVNKLDDDTRYIGMDVARTGKDKSVMALWKGTQLEDIKIVKDKNEQMDTAQQADILWEYSKENEVATSNIIVDAIGVGVGVIDSFKKEYGFSVQEFVSGAAADDGYNNLRSQTCYDLAQDFEHGRVSLYDSCPFLTEFKKEATMHEYEYKDKQIVVEGKEHIKKRLGLSPDIFDAVMMGYSLINNKSTGAVSVGDSYDLMPSDW